MAQAQVDELAVMSEQEIEWVIGGNTFVQRPLTLKRLSAVMKEIVDLLLAGGRGALLDKVVDAIGGDGKHTADASIMPILVRTVVTVPEALPHICFLILEKGADKKKEALLEEELRPRMALAIVKAFIEQNEVGALLQDFFGLMGSLQSSLDTATEELAETEEETESTVSPSVNGKTEAASEPQ